MDATVVVFDFDKTIIDLDSDNWVVDELGFTDLFNQLLPTMPWNSLMVNQASLLFCCTNMRAPFVFLATCENSGQVIAGSPFFFFTVFKGGLHYML